MDRHATLAMTSKRYIGNFCIPKLCQQGRMCISLALGAWRLAVAWRINWLIELGGHGSDLNAQSMFKPVARQAACAVA
jgi:hypothetical protein